MHPRRRRGEHRTGALTGLALGAVLLAGCSGASTGSAGPTSTAPPVPTSTGTTASPTPSTSSPTSPAGSGGSSAGPSASEGSGAKGKRITSRNGAFTVTVPKKWVDISGQFKDLGEVQLAARAPRRSHGTYPNIAVSGSAERYSGTAADAARQSAEQFRQHGAQVTEQPDLTIGGEPASGYRMLRTENATKVVQIQYFVVHDHKLYSPTGTAAPEDEQAFTRTLTSLLGSWRWS